MLVEGYSLVKGYFVVSSSFFQKAGPSLTEREGSPG